MVSQPAELAAAGFRRGADALDVLDGRGDAAVGIVGTGELEADIGRGTPPLGAAEVGLVPLVLIPGALQHRRELDVDLVFLAGLARRAVPELGQYVRLKLPRHGAPAG